MALYDTKLEWCYVKGVKADMVQNKVRITIETALDEDAMTAKRALALLAVETIPCTIHFKQHQPNLPLMPKGD